MEDVGVLTARELEILSLTGSGHSAQEIADRLQISRCTVENHKRRIYRKLGVAGQAQAVSRGLALHLLDLPPGMPRPRVPAGRELVMLHTDCVAAAEAVTRAVLGSGRALLSVRDRITGDDIAAWTDVFRFTAVLVDPLPADWLLPMRLGARAVAVPSEPPCPAMISDAMAHGAHAVLWLEDVPDHLNAVLDLVARDYMVVGAEMCRRLQPVPRLTARERDVLLSIAGGQTIKQTARLLGIASKTVESTRARLFSKLDARNRSEALANAHRAGLLVERPLDDRLTGPGWTDPPVRT